MDSFIKKYFPSVLRNLQEDDSANQYCVFKSHLRSMFTSSLYLAALASSLAASMVTRKLCRRLLLLGGVFFFVGALINAFAQVVSMLIVVGRILQGFGVEFSNQSIPLYLSETAPYKYRGALTIGFKLCITLGILLANVLNYITSKVSGDLGWRLSLGGTAVPTLIVIIGLLVLAETPNSMIERDERKEARANLRRLRGVVEVDEEFNDLVLASETSMNVEHPWKNLVKKKYRFYLMMAIAIPLFQGLSGINAIVFYAPVLFQTIGSGSNAALISVVITGGVNVLATLVSIYGVDQWGRRFLFIEGGTQMLISQIVVGIFIGLSFRLDGESKVLLKWYVVVVVMFICVYVAGFAWSWVPLGWLVPSEIFPLVIQSAAQSLNIAVNMGCTFFIAQTFLLMLCHLKFGIFFFFGFFVFVMTIFIYLVLPETENVPIDEMFVQIVIARVL